MITVTSLSKNYGNNKAVNNVNFSIKEGEIVGLLGPNGAGKSTVMNMLTGYISSTSGNIVINGHNIMDDPYEARRCIGYLPEIPPLYIDMTVEEYLSFVYELKGCTLPRRAHLEEIYKTAKLTEVSGRLIKNLSKGYKQRVGLAQALIGNPPIIILDEPTVGLDPMQVIEMRNLISELGKKSTVILSSHILSEISAVCDRIIIINKGKIVANGTPETLSNILGIKSRIKAEIQGDAQEITKVLKNIEGVLNVTSYKGSNIFTIDCSGDIRADISKVVSESGFTILMMKNHDMSLEDMFVKLVGGDKQ